jgi:hypothetical protein
LWIAGTARAFRQDRTIETNEESVGFRAPAIDPYYVSFLLAHTVKLKDLLLPTQLDSLEIIEIRGEKQGKDEEGHELF